MDPDVRNTSKRWKSNVEVCFKAYKLNVDSTMFENCLIRVGERWDCGDNAITYIIIEKVLQIPASIRIGKFPLLLIGARANKQSIAGSFDLGVNVDYSHPGQVKQPEMSRC